MDRYKITRNVYTIPTDRPSAQPPAQRPPAPTAEPIVYSVIVPFYNEAGIAEKLCHRISRVMKRLGKAYELIFINDGSTDETFTASESWLATKSPMRVFTPARLTSVSTR